jgi:hypothetical protein
MTRFKLRIFDAANTAAAQIILASPERYRGCRLSGRGYGPKSKWRGSPKMPSSNCFRRQ